MKKNILLGLLLMLVISCFAQQDYKIKYYNYNGKRTIKKYASSYRKSYWENDTLKAIDYTMKSIRKKEGAYSDKKGLIKNGLFTYYDAKGSKKTSQGSYIDNKATGYWQFWDSLGALEQTGTFVNGKCEGEWFIYFPTGEIRARRNYVADSVVKSKEFTITGIEYTENDTFTYPQVKAMFIGGEEARNIFLQKNLNYPKEARELGIEGKITLRFAVDKNGKRGPIEIMQPAGHRSLSKEAVRVVSTITDWNPALNANKPVNSWIIMPITFKLN